MCPLARFDALEGLLAGTPRHAHGDCLLCAGCIQRGTVTGLLSLPYPVTCAQPLWSAYRASAYGSGLLTIHDADTATWQWNGFVRNNVNTAGYYDDGTEVRASGIRSTHLRLVMLLLVATNAPSMRLPLLPADHVRPSLASIRSHRADELSRGHPTRIASARHIW